MPVQISAIIAAGGRGERLGGPVRKQLRTVGGRTLLERSIAPFDASERIGEIVLVLPAELVAVPPGLVRRIRTPVRLVTGGARRQDSVAVGLAAVAPESEIVVIHDAARPFCTPGLIGRTIDAAAECGAATAALPAFDTVKEARIEDGATLVSATLPRERIFLVQTPQAFRVDVLRDALARSGGGADATDEATLVERAGHPVRMVQGDMGNFKVTSQDDLSLAEQMVSAGPMETRVGLGYDLHRFVDGRPLVLGGVSIPSPRGLLGHSDADAVCHAVTDAVLGAAGAGDIGQRFPDNDERWKGAASIELLRDAMGAVRGMGFAVGNVDVVVVTERPKIRAVAQEMRRRLADALLVAPDRVSIKGKTGEGVGEVGRGEALAVHAVAILVAPGRQGVTREHARRYVTEDRRSQEGATSTAAVVPQGAHSAPRRTRRGAKGSPLGKPGVWGAAPSYMRRPKAEYEYVRRRCERRPRPRTARPGQHGAGLRGPR